MTVRKPINIALALTWLCLTGLAAEVVAQSPELIVEIENQEIYEGESVLYRVTLNHVENPNAPKLVGFDDFQITSLGEQSLDSRQITIINGRRSEIIRRGRQYNYRLTPTKSGTLTIPAPTATIDGKVLTGRMITLKVIPPDEQDSVIVEFAADRSSVYPMQPFELSLTIAVKDMPGEIKDRDPLTVQPKPPALDVAWLDDDRLPEGIEAEQSWREILEPLVSRRGNGFQINNIGTSSVFSLFEDDATGFHPKPTRTTRKDANGQDTGYWEYHFSRKLMPRKLGTYQFPTVTLKGTFADGIENGQLVGRRIYAPARGVEIAVRDVPLDGRPESYIGAVGTFDVRAELAPPTARVGDPMTLTVTLSGQGTLDDARPPTLDGLAGIENAFRTYDATEESTSHSRRFTYSLRPLSTDVSEFPAIPVSYFDVEAEKYVTANTNPISVTIREAETLSDSEIVSAPADTSSSASSLEASEGGIFANDANLTSLRNEAVHPAHWVAAWAAMILCWAAASLGVRQAKRVREDPALLRRRSAVSRARATLNEATPEDNDPLRRAVTGLIADYADVPEAGLTPKDAAAHLEAFGIGQPLQSRTRAFLNDCDAARYGAVPDVSRKRTEANELLEQLIVEFRNAKRMGQGSPRLASATVILISLMIGGCGQTPDLETSRKLQGIESAFTQAKTPDDFALVASQYEQLGNNDFQSGALFYNIGNAWMRAGAPGRAIAAYRQAQRYRPRDPYLAANLQSALAATGRATAATGDAGVADYLLFWQEWVSYPEKLALTTSLLAAAIIASLLSQLTRHRSLCRRTAMGTGILTLLSVTSIALDWYDFDQTQHGVVIADEVIARKGNSENYEPAFTNALREGMEFVIVDHRTKWLQIQIDDSELAWIPTRTASLY